VSQRPCLASTKTPVAKIKSPKTKPAENIDGFVSGLTAPQGRRLSKDRVTLWQL
jgi:hypothetical protein